MAENIDEAARNTAGSWNCVCVCERIRLSRQIRDLQMNV